MDTTTSEDGAVTAQPNNEAGADEGAMVVMNDDMGTPTMVPMNQVRPEPNVASTQDETQEDTQEKAAEEPTVPDAQADSQEIVEWAKKKGLEINPENPNEVKLAKLQLENDRRFHEQQQKIKVLPPELIEESEDPALNAVVERQNNSELKLYVRDWFDANSEMKEHREDLAQISAQYPYIPDMDVIKSIYLGSQDRSNQLKQEGGRQALENLAQKQSAVPPQASASNTSVYSSDTVITPQNVYDLVDRMDQRWFEKNHDAISRAMSGK